jgi:hypothetical protein
MSRGGSVSGREQGNHKVHILLIVCADDPQRMIEGCLALLAQGAHAPDEVHLMGRRQVCGGFTRSCLRPRL